MRKINQSGYTSHQGFYQTYAWLDLIQICFTWPSCFNQIFLPNTGTFVNNNKRWKFLNFWSLYHLSGFCLEQYTEHEYPISSDPEQKEKFLYSNLAIAIDNLYFMSCLLGYMRCLFFKAVTESFIFLPVLFCLVGFYFIVKILRSFNCSQNHLKLYNFDHDFEVRWKIFRELFLF